jgi:flavodoxin
MGGPARQTLIVTFSAVGNTRRIAEAISEVLEARGPVRLICTGQITITWLDEAEEW